MPANNRPIRQGGLNGLTCLMNARCLAPFQGARQSRALWTRIFNRKGEVRLNPATRNSTQIQKLSVFLFIFVLLILPAVVIVSASLVAATQLRDADDQEMSTYSRQAAGDIKSEKELAQGKFLVADRRLMDPNFRETVVLLIRYVGRSSK